jgi:histidinol-phosphate aminotransferase
MNQSGKEYLYKELASLGFQYVPTQANFIYIVLKQDSSSLYNALLRKGIIVRPMGPRAIRVTIGLPEENKRFIHALGEIRSFDARLEE